VSRLTRRDWPPPFKRGEEWESSGVSRLQKRRGRPRGCSANNIRDEPQNLLEHLPCDGDLGHLEDNIAAVAHDFRADLDQLVLCGKLSVPL